MKYQVTEQSVLAACQTAKVPCHKVGDEYRFTPSDMGRLTSLMARKKLPEEVLSDSVSKDELRQWIADERELREGAEGAEIVLGHCEENWSLKE